MMRIGHGFDVHKFGGDAPLIIAGVTIPNAQGVLAHSDGDVALHALCDALLGAIAAGDIGHHFPDTQVKWKKADSRELLKTVYQMVLDKGYQLVNADLTLLAQKPKISPYAETMCQSIAKVLNTSRDNINVKASTTEEMGFIGRKEGIACEVVVLLKSVNQ